MKISRTIALDYGHCLPDHFGFCSQLHGHRATVVAEFAGELHTEGSSNGMVEDFSILKTIMMQNIHGVLDHAFAIWKDDATEPLVVRNDDGAVHVRTIDFVRARNKRVLITDMPPTAEYLAEWAFKQIAESKLFQKTGVRLTQVQWWETPNNCATYSEPVEQPVIGSYKVFVQTTVMGDKPTGNVAEPFNQPPLPRISEVSAHDPD